MNSVRVLGAVHALSRQKTRQLGDPNPEYLLRQDVIDALREIRNLLTETLIESLDYLAQKDTRFRTGVKESDLLVRPNVLAIVAIGP